MGSLAIYEGGDFDDIYGNVPSRGPSGREIDTPAPGVEAVIADIVMPDFEDVLGDDIPS